MRLLWVLVAVGLAGMSGEGPKSVVGREAHEFIAGLNAEQRKAAVLGFDLEARTDWHYVPRERKGISWKQLDAKQKVAAHALLKASLSKAGYDKVEALRGLEPVLREMERGNPGRDLENYSFVFFGEPSDTEPWSWRYEGHHISLTFTYQRGALVASTPQFLGSNPAEVLSGPLKGKRILDKEQDLAFKLVQSLTPSQLEQARVGDQAPGDIITTNVRHAAIEGRRGLSYSKMSAPQRKALLELLRAHAEVQSEKEQVRRMEGIQKEDLDDLVFAWLGPIERKARHYYRIQGRHVLVEYDNTQSDGNHIHTVWRNLTEDFGDPLREHYQHGHP